MASYDLDYALARLHEAIDYAEMDGDFQPARKWVNEVEKSAQQSVHPTSGTLPVLQALSTPEQFPALEVLSTPLTCGQCKPLDPSEKNEYRA